MFLGGVAPKFPTVRCCLWFSPVLRICVLVFVFPLQFFPWSHLSVIPGHTLLLSAILTFPFPSSPRRQAARRGPPRRHLKWVGDPLSPFHFGSSLFLRVSCLCPWFILFLVPVHHSQTSTAQASSQAKEISICLHSLLYVCLFVLDAFPLPSCPWMQVSLISHVPQFLNIFSCSTIQSIGSLICALWPLGFAFCMFDFFLFLVNLHSSQSWAPQSSSPCDAISMFVFWFFFWDCWFLDFPIHMFHFVHIAPSFD